MSLCWIPNNCPQETRHCLIKGDIGPGPLLHSTPFFQAIIPPIPSFLCEPRTYIPSLLIAPPVLEISPWLISIFNTQNFYILNKYPTTSIWAMSHSNTGLHLSYLLQTSTFITSTFSSVFCPLTLSTLGFYSSLSLEKFPLWSTMASLQQVRALAQSFRHFQSLLYGVDHSFSLGTTSMIQLWSL